MLNIIVCVKVVTDPKGPVSTFKIDPEGKRVLPAPGVPVFTNKGSGGGMGKCFGHEVLAAGSCNMFNAKGK